MAGDVSMNAVRHAVYTESCLGETVTAEITLYPNGIHAAVHGGSLPHIGAVSVIDAEGSVQTIQYPGHKDAAISDRWARRLSELGYGAVVITAGVHYDDLPRTDIQRVLQATDRLLDRIQNALRGSLNREPFI